MEPENKQKSLLPSDIAKYFLAQAINDGELISPLKMQKLVYYAYVWYLIMAKSKLFDEPIEAWPMGPVAPSLYEELKQYGSAPIPAEYIGGQEVLDELLEKLDSQQEVLRKVYEKYDTLTAFELVVLTHSEKPWIEARKGLKPEEPSNNPLSDGDILTFYQAEDLK